MDENTNEITTPQEPTPFQMAEPLSSSLPAAPASSDKGKGVRTYVVAGVSAVVGAVLVLGAGVVGYTIGNHDSDNRHSATLTVSGERGDQQGGQQGGAPGNGPMMGGDGQRGVDPDGDNWTGGGQQGGAPGNDPMMGGDGQRGVDPDGDSWTGGNRGGGMMGGQQDGQQGGALGNGPMMQGNGIQDFLNQLQSGQGVTRDQQQFLDQLKGFVGGMRNQMG